MAETEESVLRFLEGDEEAFRQIVQRWQTKVYNLAWRFLGNREDAQDIVQETFFSVFKSIGTLREPRSFSTWLYRITLNHCRARWRSQTSDLSLDDPILGTAETQRELALGHGTAQDSLETADLIRKALMGLSDECRTAIILKEYVGLSLEEVANVVCCPLSTAKSRLYHGLRGVQRNLRRMGLRD